jgi:ubiquinone/menaquinone biosynthesis C-methylase UbiE
MKMNDLAKLYQDRFSNTGEERRNAVWKTLCRHFFSRFVRPEDRVLDVACGYGEFINNIVAREKFAIDLNPDSAARLDPAVTFLHDEATDLSKIPDASIDAVFSSNFLEHLKSKDDVLVLLREIFRVLAPGGKVLLLGPNVKYAYREYWDFFDHHLALSHASVGEALHLTGFALDRVIPRFLPFTMNNKAPTHEALIVAYLNMPFAWRLFGKQFFIVGSKP